LGEKDRVMLDKNIDLSNKRVIVTGAAGFIGSNLCMELIKRFEGIKILGLDNVNNYYDVGIKKDRLNTIAKLLGDAVGTAGEYGVSETIGDSKFVFIKGNIADRAVIDKVFDEFKPEVVVNLAAQAGVRYSIENPDAYIEANLIGFYNILEACRHSYDADKKTDDYNGVEHLVYASSSSVYGSNKKIPYSTDDKVDNPVSLYAATKKSNELLAHSYTKLYGIPSTGLRFFTVYGPAGRPDMAYFGFTNKLVKGETIKIFNFGNCKRDFTYVDDIVEGVINVMEKAPDENENGVRYKVYNIGNNDPVNLLDFVDILQQELVSAGVLPQDYDFEAHKELVPMQPGDVEVTYADVTPLQQDFGFKPNTPLREGLRRFAKWYKEYYG
jgi:nucleoside-diphosphate-sugar epimerase